MSVLSRSTSGVLAALLCWACRDEPASKGPPSGASPPSPASEARAEGLAAGLEAEQVRHERARKVLNPRGLQPYDGPVGGVRGTVVVSGDPPPPMTEMAAKLPTEGCSRAHEMQRKLFRKGPRGTLGDALVTVTRYTGFLPARSEAVRVDVRDCAFPSRTIALTFGQRLDVYNHDEVPYMPRLVGAPTQVLRVAVQDKAPVPLFVPKPGRYALVEQSRQYMVSDVFALLYPTFDVTDLDGEFSIEGVPVGEVKVNAYSPAIGKTVEETVLVRAGEIATLELELVFVASEFEAAREKARQKAGVQAPKP